MQYGIESMNNKLASMFQSKIERVNVSIFLESSTEILDARRELHNTEESYTMRCFDKSGCLGSNTWNISTMLKMLYLE